MQSGCTLYFKGHCQIQNALQEHSACGLPSWLCGSGIICKSPLTVIFSTDLAFKQVFTVQSLEDSQSHRTSLHTILCHKPGKLTLVQIHQLCIKNLLCSLICFLDSYWNSWAYIMSTGCLWSNHRLLGWVKMSGRCENNPKYRTNLKMPCKLCTVIFLPWNGYRVFNFRISIELYSWFLCRLTWVW